MWLPCLVIARYKVLMVVDSGKMKVLLLLAFKVKVIQLMQTILVSVFNDCVAVVVLLQEFIFIFRK